MPGPLQKQASRMATRQVRTAQNANTLDANTKARNVNAAARAASGYLNSLGLGTGLASSYRTAGKDQAALGAGFSGDVRSTVDAESAKVNRGLAAIGAPGPVASTSVKAGNVVYALGGQIPASVLLTQAPLAMQDNAISVRSLTGQGAQTAAGFQGAAAAENRKLEQQLPDLTMSYLTQLRSDRDARKQQRFENNLAERQLQDAENQAAYNRQQAEAQAKAAAQAAATTPDATLSKTVGYVVNSAGQAIPGPDGQPQLLPGYKWGKNGRPVKTGGTSKGKSSATRGLSRSQTLKARGTALTIAEGAYYGATDSSGNALPKLSYSDALLEMQKEGIPMKIAVAALNRFYKPGQQGRPPKTVSASGNGITVYANASTT